MHRSVAALELDGFAIFLQKGEFGNELGELTSKAAFLESEIAEIFLVAPL